MKICKYCRQDLPDDSTFCTHCGKSLVLVKEQPTGKLTKRQRAEIQKEEVKKEKATRNNWIWLGVILFLVGLILFDFILGTLFSALKMDYKVVFIISMLIYIGAICCGIMAIITDNKAKKAGLEPNGNMPLAIAEIVFSSYIILMNIQNIVLK